MSLTSLPRQFYVNTPSETNEQWAIDAWLFPPDSIHRVVPVLFCQPGGGYDKSYWHLEVPGCAPEAYSFARFMAKQGCLVVAIDHLGTGQSSKPEAGRLLTAEHIAAANAEVVEQVRQALLDGTLLPDLLPRRPEQMRFFVVGHSMGAFLALYLWHLVDAMALLGWTSRAEIGLQGSAAQAGAALGQTLPADATLNTLATFIPPELDYLPSLKALLHPLFYLDDVPEAVIQADEARGTHLPTGIMKTLCNVSDVRQLARKIAVPLFLANGDRDVSPDFASEPKAYEQATDITLFTVSGSAHCHNLASSRFALWNRLATWIMEQCRLVPDAEFQKTHVLSR